VPRCTPLMSRIAMVPGLSSRPSTSCFVVAPSLCRQCLQRPQPA
jgi:hypothetical protein